MLTHTGESGGSADNRFLYGHPHPQQRGDDSAMVSAWQPHQYQPQPQSHVDMHSAVGSAWPDDPDADEDVSDADAAAEELPTTGGKRPKRTTGASAAKKDVFICAEVHCGKQFPRSFALRRHMRIHTGNKPYVCDHDGCAQRFNTSGNLSRHKRIHSGERPYPCIFATCGKRFNTSTKLKRHMRIHFPDGQNLFRCIGVNCSWSCDNYKEFAQHQKLHHNIIVGAAQSQSHPSHHVAQAAAIAAAAQHQQENDAALRNTSAPSQHQGIKTDPDYFLTDHRQSHHEYDSGLQHHQQQHQSANTSGSFLFKQTPSGPPRKLMGQFYVSEMGLPVVLQKDQKKSHEIDHGYSDSRRGSTSSSNGGKSAIAGHAAFPLSEHGAGAPQYHHSRSSSYEASTFTLNAESSYARPAASVYSNHYAHMRSDNSSDGNEDYEQQHHQQAHHHSHHSQHHSSRPSHHHVLRPPPHSDDNMKFGGFSVPPPMNPAAPEFTGEELSVVLELMKDSYC